MKKYLSFNVCVIASALIIISLSSCSSITARGRQEIYEFTVTSYDKVRVEGSIKINYYASPSNKVILALQPNIREYYTVEVINGELIVRPTREISFKSNNFPVLTISTPVLNQLLVSGACEFTAFDKITSDSLTVKISGAAEVNAEVDVNNFSVDLSGAGELKFSGRADTADFRLSGAGNINALSLTTTEAVINVSGASTIRISCSEILSVMASGACTVEYRGSPRVNQNISGAVNIRQIER